MVNLLLLAPDDDPLRVETFGVFFYILILIYILSVGVKTELLSITTVAPHSSTVTSPHVVGDSPHFSTPSVLS
jgi:hypothetical protein